MFNKIKVAAVSMKPARWQKEKNARKMESFIRRAARRHPDLIVLPEGLLDGYPISEVILFPERRPAFLEAAEPIDGPYIARFRRLARELGICLSFGFSERIGREAYNCAIVLDKKGNICGKYHKTELAEGYHPSWYFNRLGKSIRAIDTPLGRCGMLICRDRFNPMIARTLVLDGARLLLISSYGSKEREQNVAVLARARENGVPIVEANVGMNLIISKGEIVAYKWGADKITHAEIEVPAEVSRRNARAHEKNFLRKRGPMMKKFYQRIQKAIRAGNFTQDGMRSTVKKKERDS